MKEENDNCTKRTVEICGLALELVYKRQYEYKLKHKRHLSFERAVNHVILNEKELKDE